MADLELCSHAFYSRKSDYMIELERRGHGDDRGTMVGTSNTQLFKSIYHYLGGFGSYLRITKLIAAAAIRLPQLFDSFQVKLKQSSGTMAFPQTDDLTTLDRVATRVLPKGSPDLVNVQNSLAYLDEKFGVFREMTEKYNEK